MVASGMMFRLPFFIVLLVSLAPAPCRAAAAKVIDYAPVTAVVYNKNQAESKKLAHYYASQRGVPETNLVGIDCPEEETITRLRYTALIETPLRKAFKKRKWWKIGKGEDGTKQAVENKIRVLVLMRGVPLRIAENRPPSGIDPLTKKPQKPAPIKPGSQNQASVDSELAMLGYLKAKSLGPLKNPYYQKDGAFSEAGFPWMLMVGRIDGPDNTVAGRLVSDAIAAEKTGLWGKVYIDLAQRNTGGYKEGETWLNNCAKIYRDSGFSVVTDPYPPRFPVNYPMGDASLYFGWYTGNVDGPFKNPNFKFRRGAVACHIHSFSATTLRDPGAYWAAPLLKAGACAVLGNVWEPYLSLTQHLDIFSARLLQGYTFIEATYMSMPALSWMNTAVGDPLYRPFHPQTSLEVGGENRDYKALRVAKNRWRKEEQRDAFLKNVMKGAEGLGSGALYEELGLLAAAAKNASAAGEFFERAASSYESPADQLRVRLHAVDLLRVEGKKREAAAALRKLRLGFASIPEVKAIDSLVLQLDPPPPPPPPAPTRKSATTGAGR